MRRWTVVILGCVLTFGAWTGAQNIGDIVFYDSFESGDTAGWWAPARVGETGQTTCYNAAGAVIDCAATGQNGELQTGVAWPNPRFVDNSDGTVTDMLTGLVWLKDASCADLAGTDANGIANWTTALTAAQALAAGTCGLTDDSAAGEWRLPTINELQSLIDYEFYSPALSNATGTGAWSEGNIFTGVQSPGYYWSSTSNATTLSHAWYVDLWDGTILSYNKTNPTYSWPVRNGQ